MLRLLHIFRLKCTEPRVDRVEYPSAQVYLADPWYPAAAATVANFQIGPAPPDDHTVVFTAEHDALADGFGPLDAAGNPAAADRLVHNTSLGTVDVPLEYEIGFDILPGATTVPTWGNIIRLTATNHDCCNYGDRIPGVSE